MSSNIDLKTLCSVNLQMLPDEALKSLEFAFRHELDRRQVQRKVSIGTELNLHSKKFLKKFGFYEHNRHLSKYLDGIIDEDWSHLFKGDLNPVYYVYAHFVPGPKEFHFEHSPLKIHIPGLPFYIGKGSGNRAFDLSRNDGHGATLRDLAKNFKSHEFIHIVAKDLTEPQALELESKLIFFFGTKYETSRKGLLTNLTIPPRPF